MKGRPHDQLLQRGRGLCEHRLLDGHLPQVGHGTDDYYGGIVSGSLSEALGDIHALYKTGQPICGQDFFGPGTYVRTGENNTKWPASSCGGEPHCVGETYMGFAWQLYKALKVSLGSTAGSRRRRRS